MNDSWKRRYPHPVAGNYHSVPSRRPNGHDDIVFVPSSPPTLRAETRRFSLDFLPGGIGPWEIVDSRCSLVLLAKRKKSGWMRCCFPDLLVCELVTRRYQLIPRMEEMKRHRCVCVFLGECQSGIVSKPGRFTEWAIVDSMSQFSVVYEELIGVADGIGTIRSCSFFSGRKWYVEKKKKKSSPTYEDTHVVHLHGPESLRFLGRGPYCPFWSIEGDSKRLLTPSLRQESSSLTLMTQRNQTCPIRMNQSAQVCIAFDHPVAMIAFFAFPFAIFMVTSKHAVLSVYSRATVTTLSAALSMYLFSVRTIGWSRLESLFSFICVALSVGMDEIGCFSVVNHWKTVVAILTGVQFSLKFR
ncbi:hypothetical protein ACQ4PT_017962 [Festuca glaucescens]